MTNYPKSFGLSVVFSKRRRVGRIIEEFFGSLSEKIISQLSFLPEIMSIRAFMGKDFQTGAVLGVTSEYYDSHLAYKLLQTVNKIAYTIPNVCQMRPPWQR